MGTIAILFHRPVVAGTLDFETLFGFEGEPEAAIEQLTGGRVTEDYHDYPLDDDAHNLFLYMRSQTPDSDARELYELLTSRLVTGGRVLVEIFRCDDKLRLTEKMHSNATPDLYWGSEWESGGTFEGESIWGLPIDPRFRKR